MSNNAKAQVLIRFTLRTKKISRTIAVPMSFRTYEAMFRAELVYLNRLDLDTCHIESNWVIE